MQLYRSNTNSKHGWKLTFIRLKTILLVAKLRLSPRFQYIRKLRDSIQNAA